MSSMMNVLQIVKRYREDVNENFISWMMAGKDGYSPVVTKKKKTGEWSLVRGTNKPKKSLPLCLKTSENKSYKNHFKKLKNLKALKKFFCEISKVLKF